MWRMVSARGGAEVLRQRNILSSASRSSFQFLAKFHG